MRIDFDMPQSQNKVRRLSVAVSRRNAGDRAQQHRNGGAGRDADRDVGAADVAALTNGLARASASRRDAAQPEHDHQAERREQHEQIGRAAPAEALDP